MRTPSARGPLREIEGLNKALKWLYYDGKGNDDERRKVFRAAREKAVSHLTREASRWWSMILSRVLPILLRRWERIRSGTWGQSRRSVGLQVGEIGSQREVRRCECKRVGWDKENRNNHQQYEDKIPSHRVLDVSCHANKSQFS